MQPVKLSILIPSTRNRQQMTDALTHNILMQGLNQPIEVLLDWNETNCVGKKRNDLLQRANGEYIVFVDSDDHISPDYIAKILPACSGVDCIGISGIITTNGANKRQWHISKEYKTWHEANNIYYRTPNHISPVRRDLALQAGFPEISFGEDAEYSRRLLPLLKTENIVIGNIYHYDYRTK